MGTPTDFDPTKACFKCSCGLNGKRHETDAFRKLGEPTIRAACTPRTVLDQHFWCIFWFILILFLTGIGPSLSRTHCTPNKCVRPTLQSKHAASGPDRLGSWPDDSCTLACLRTGSIWPKPDTITTRTKLDQGWFCTILSGMSVEERNRVWKWETGSGSVASC